jgi:hypothetical protein
MNGTVNFKNDGLITFFIFPHNERIIISVKLVSRQKYDINYFKAKMPLLIAKQ